MQQRTKAISQRPQLALGSSASVTTRTLNTRANGPNGHKHSSCQEKARTLDSKLKGALPQNNFLNKTAPQTQTGGTAINGRGVPDGSQTNAGVKKTTAGDRRYFDLIPNLNSLRCLGKPTGRDMVSQQA